MSLHRVGLTVASTLLLAACSRCGGGTELPAGSVDGGDSGGDAAEVAVDSGRVDSEASDVDTPTSDWPGWRRMKESGGCRFDVPVDLAAQLPPWKWVPCSNGAAGCEEMVPTWPAAGTDKNIYFDGLHSGITMEGEAALLRLDRRIEAFEPKGDVYDQAVYDVDKGVAVAAYRSDDGVDAAEDGCRLFAIPGRGALTLLSQVPTLGVRYARRQLTDPPEPTWLTLSAFSTLAYQQSHHTSATLLAWDSPAAGMIVRVPIGSASYSIYRPPPKGGLILDFVVDDLMYSPWYWGVDGWGQYYQIDASGKERLYRGVSGRHIRRLISDGAWVFWAEEYGRTSPTDEPTTSDIFVAPYTTDPDKLAATAKKLKTVPHAMGGMLHASDGIVQLFETDETVLLVRHDGAYQYVSGSPGLGLQDAGIIRGGKYYCLTGKRNASGIYPHGMGLARFTLGAWTTP